MVCLWVKYTVLMVFVMEINLLRASAESTFAKVKQDSVWYEMSAC